MTNKLYPTREIVLATNFEAIAVTITLPHTSITTCNIYITNQKEFNLYDIEQIIQHLPHPYIMVGDFNSYSETWGSYKSDLIGEINFLQMKISQY